MGRAARVTVLPVSGSNAGSGFGSASWYPPLQLGEGQDAVDRAATSSSTASAFFAAHGPTKTTLVEGP